MNDNLRRNLELIGIAAVVASLIFVGIQLIFDRRVALGNAYQARAESRMENLRSQANSENMIKDAVERIESGERPYYYTNSIEIAGKKTGYSLEHLVRLALLNEINAVSIDNNYYQRSLGLLEEGYWEALVVILKQMKRSENFAWEIYRAAPISAAFSDYLKELEP